MRGECHLTERDGRLLRTLGSYCILSSDQLQRMVFPGVRMATAYRRLRKLERSGYLKRYWGLGGGQAAWAVLKKAEPWMDENEFLAKVNPAQIKHDVAVSEIRWTLERSGVARNWLNEATMRRRVSLRDSLGSNKVPDGVFTIRSAKGDELRCALEVEISPKTLQAYKDNFKEYLYGNQYWFVWYAVETAMVGRRLLGYWEKMKTDHSKTKFGWSTIESIVSSSGTFEIHSDVGQLMLRAPAQKVLSSCSASEQGSGQKAQ